MSGQDTFAQTVWERLSREDVTPHTDVIEATGKRPQVTYLSWSKAWMLLKREFPGSTYAHRPDIWHPDGTVEVEVDVVISDGSAESMFTNARLGVMNYYFGPIENPSAREINDARQRCLVKALAFAGLGLNLWSDSSIPVGKLDDPISPDQYDKLNALLEETGSDRDKFLNWCEVEELQDLPFERYESALRLLQAKKRRQELAAEREKDDG
jgi:hypothetical protein